MPFSAADSGGGADSEDERNDDNRQQYGEDRAEVLLKGFLNPGNHGEKPPTLGRATLLARAKWASARRGVASRTDSHPTLTWIRSLAPRLIPFDAPRTETR